jgi:hypothetical protein
MVIDEDYTLFYIKFIREYRKIKLNKHILDSSVQNSNSTYDQPIDFFKAVPHWILSSQFTSFYFGLLYVPVSLRT